MHKDSGGLEVLNLNKFMVRKGDVKDKEDILEGNLGKIYRNKGKERKKEIMLLVWFDSIKIALLMVFPKLQFDMSFYLCGITYNQPYN